ncbi:hypothetical protein K8R32_05405 [bacterium]|nr:hypothetical protein [bacterium]
MLNSKLTLTKLIITVFLTLGLSISFQSLLAQWTPPTGAPPNNNASKLLQASSTPAGRQIMEDAFEVQNFLDVFSGFSADGDTLFVDQVNNRVGIGTTSPFGTLDVDGNLCISGDCISDWSGMGGGGAITYTTSSYYDTCGNGTCDRTTDIGAHDFCALSRVGGPGGFNTLCRVYESAGSWMLLIRDGDAGQTHSCEAMCFDSSGSGGGSSLWTAGTGDDIYHDSGNVGIGTNNPQNKLTVQAVAAERTLYLWNNATNPELALGDGTANNHWAIYNDLASDDLFFWKDGANRMVITDDGNMGIGTDNPDTGTGGQLKLDVEGNVGANNYCDANGDNCTAATSLGGGSPSGTVTGGCTYGSAWGTATVCGLGAGMACSAGHTARVIVFCNAGGCSWNSAGNYAHGFCIRD